MDCTYKQNKRENMKMSEIVNNLMDSWFRHHELLFTDGRLYQRETNGMGQTRFIDVTEEVAKAISKYPKTND